MTPPIRKTKFVPEWIDMTPRIPVPKIDWITEKKLDVPYGGAALQKLDIYYPKAQKQAYPTVILVHGGGFTLCDKRDWHLYPGFHALEADFALVSVNYRLAPADPFPAAVDDLKAAVCYLRENAASLRLNADNFFLYGTSAGGNLVSYVGLDGASSRDTEHDFHVNAVAALCPLINFADWVEQVAWYWLLVPGVREMLNGYMGGMPKRVPQLAKEASADSRIAPYPPAFYLQHGDQDFGVKMQQSIDFYNKLKASGFFRDEDLILDILKGADHAGAGPEFLEIGHVQPILDFFRRHTM